MNEKQHSLQIFHFKSLKDKGLHPLNHWNDFNIKQMEQVMSLHEQKQTGKANGSRCNNVEGFLLKYDHISS